MVERRREGILAREDDFVGQAGSHSYLELPQAVDRSWPTAKPAADCCL